MVIPSPNLQLGGCLEASEEGIAGPQRANHRADRLAASGVRPCMHAFGSWALIPPPSFHGIPPAHPLWLCGKYGDGDGGS